jgi:lipid-binding SYLF domain-containing protein
MSTRMLAAVVGLAALMGGPVIADEAKDARETVGKAVKTFGNFSADPEMGEFRRKLGEAQGVMIFPKVVRAGFIFGGSGGRGVLIARGDEGNDWSPPVFYTMGSGSVGLQIGAQVSEVVLLIMSQKGIDALLSSKVQFGGDVSIAAGPVGTGVQGANADVLGFVRAKGAFAGLSLDSAYVDPDDSRNAAYYDREDISPVDILVRRDVDDQHARELRDTVARAARDER